jgi:hypothetical protein
MPSTISAGTTAGTAIAVAGDTTGNLAFQTNGTTTAMTIDTSQNVGIGTASPTQKLHVSNTSGSIQARVSSDTDVSVAAVASGADSTAFMTVINDARQWTLRVNGAESDQFQVRDSTAGANRMTIDSSGNLGFNSGYGSVATAYGCRAWVNFNGNGTVAIRGSGNVSSITDGGTGQYTVNLTTALPDANAAVAAAVSENGALSDKNRVFCANMATSSTAFIHVYASTNEADEDVAFVAVSIFR